MFSEAVTDVGQIKSIRDAAYKSGFAMAASIISNYVRNCERDRRPLNKLKLKSWSKNSQQWRNVSSLNNAPEII